MPVPYINASTGQTMNSGHQSTYGSGLGTIYQYGHANPYGPYYGLNKPQANKPQTSASGSSSTSTGAGAEGFLQGVVSGQNLPYSPFAQNQMMGQQADMAAAAEQAQLQQINEGAVLGGASATDPSLQGARRQAMSSRQNQNLQSQRDISSRATQANFAAQMDAARALQQAQMTREGWQQQSQGNALSFMPWNQPYQYQQNRPQSYINFYGF